MVILLGSKSHGVAVVVKGMRLKKRDIYLTCKVGSECLVFVSGWKV